MREASGFFIQSLRRFLMPATHNFRVIDSAFLSAFHGDVKSVWSFNTFLSLFYFTL
jgi:hypothetical protein